VVLRRTASASPEIAPDTPTDEKSAELDSYTAGIAVGVSSQMVDLWIDLVSQASDLPEPDGPLPSVTDLGRQQFKALINLQKEALTIGELARRLGVSNAAASLVAESLINAGTAERYQDALDRRVVATVAGMQIASEYRATQVEILEMLLGKLDPARRTVLVMAMKEIAQAMDWTSIASVDNMLIPDPDLLTAN
jgi:DNA-binding MarR family transcriptional regulator